MDEIMYRQKNAPKAMTGRRFLLGAAGIVLRLAVAQIAVNALIALSGVGLLNVAFYLYAVALLIGFMRRTVAGSVYALGARTLTLQSLLGDSTTSVVQIPLRQVIALRPVMRCENLRLCYAQVTAVDAAARPGFRMRAAFFASLFSARLARRIAGKRARQRMGWAAVFKEEGRLRACVFRPDETLLRSLAAVLPDAFDVDDRMTRERIHTIYARSLARAFHEAYPHVEPLVREEDMRWAAREIERQKGERQAARAEEQQRRQLRAAAVQRKKAQKKKKRKGKGKNAADDGEELIGIAREDEEPAQERRPKRGKKGSKNAGTKALQDDAQEPHDASDSGAPGPSEDEEPFGALGEALARELEQEQTDSADEATQDTPSENRQDNVRGARADDAITDAQRSRRRRRPGGGRTGEDE